MAEVKEGASVGVTTDGNRGYPAVTYRDEGAGDGVHRVVGHPYEKEIHINGAVAVTGLVICDVDVPTAVVGITESHTVAEATAVTAKAKVERAQGTEGATQGDDLLAASGAGSIDAKGAANTKLTGTVIKTSGINVLAAGDRLLLHFALDNATAQATTEYRGTVKVTLAPVTLVPVATS